MICRRCCGSGSLLRMKRDPEDETKLLPVIQCFKKCTTCGGKGTSHPPFGPKQYLVGTKGFYLYPEI